ncbi:MAG: ribosome small subunit-dependent GTPase A [Planctomycetes bacterium]|jgi:ribosome biogenesis GTPase|nr:ribosome small subunit-dependent GTPase A [Planctomycetota bacterium]
MQPSSPSGLVLRIDAKVCHVEVDGERCLLPLAGKLFEARSHEKRPLAVGDRVLLDPTGKAIDSVLPRSSQLHRRAASEGEDQAQVMAANITHVIAVASIASPPFQPELVDGVLAAAQRERIPATLVLSKIDLDPELAARWAKVYAHAGVRVLPTSTAAEHATSAALAELGTLLHQNNSVVVGLSGAGKSSLLNALVPGITLRTGDLNHIRQGRHTTTHTELLPLPGGGHVLDTPGVRNFHLFCTGSQELQFLFPEIAAKLPECEYRSCLHDGEQNCAVKAALQRGELPESRYRSYRTMLVEALAAERPGQKAGRTPVRGGGRRRPRN